MIGWYVIYCGWQGLQARTCTSHLNSLSCTIEETTHCISDITLAPVCARMKLLLFVCPFCPSPLLPLLLSIFSPQECTSAIRVMDGWISDGCIESPFFGPDLGYLDPTPNCPSRLSSRKVQKSGTMSVCPNTRQLRVDKQDSNKKTKILNSKKHPHTRY